MQSGIYYGFVGQVDGILSRLHAEMPDLKNGRRHRRTWPSSSVKARQFIREVNPMLTLVGLKLIHDRQHVS